MAKYTDEQVKKALMQCKAEYSCKGCPYEAIEDCFVIRNADTLDLINRQEAEIERLGVGTALNLADCTLVVKKHSEIGDKPEISTIGIKFKAGDETYGFYREYTSYSTLADVCRELTGMLNKKNEVQRRCNEYK